ncbi:MAG: DUF3846 domain-containing protein [Ruminococcaceae bacterium]|jgi:hypothetical protein|nr:DUF3846 domain-containing protein [Oscillospiraceae bacterium]
MERSIRVVVIEPEKPARITEIGQSLESMQSVVGGYIQVIPAQAIPGGEKLSHQMILVLNEEGKLDDLPYNFEIWDGADYIAGTCFVCKEKGDEMVGLTEEEANIVVSLFNRKGHVDG